CRRTPARSSARWRRPATATATTTNASVISTRTAIPGELITRIAPPATNRQRWMDPVRSGACDAGGAGPGDGADAGGLRDRCLAPRVRVGKHRRDQSAGQGMAGPQPAEMPDDRSAGQIKVAQRIDQLVADELVGKTQPAII